MKYLDEFRDGRLAETLSRAIAAETSGGRRYRLMEFCGGHTHAISRYGIEDLLPGTVHLVHGPGCPVCVLPVGRIDGAIHIAGRPGVILCTYGDVMRVPASNRVSLIKAKAQGLDVRMVYSILDALDVARRNPDRTVVFLAIGFETTTPPTALAVKAAEAEGIGNFLVYVNHVLTPAAIGSILEDGSGTGGGPAALDGIIGPAHVSAVIGTRPYEVFARDHRTPVVIAGFEPLDVMQAILMLVRQLNAGRHEVENEYTRAVTRDGNGKARELIAEVFELRSTFEWRGLGLVPFSALRLKEAYARFDAERRFEVPVVPVADNPACACGAIVRGLGKPTDCKLFGTACTPDDPMGSCMVSAEGACAAHWAYGRFRDRQGRTG
ncbi:MAG: hydrogenase formation protein HypD [Alphaproteobacteria bacterium]|nr:hydrogenase formation protein HypD [Alphaproteobacteria bacterium]